MKDTQTEQKEQTAPTQAEQEKTRFAAFLDRLTIFQHTPMLPVRKWLAVVGIVLFIGLVIAYYLVNGG